MQPSLHTFWMVLVTADRLGKAIQWVSNPTRRALTADNWIRHGYPSLHHECHGVDLTGPARDLLTEIRR